jgi:hypothetical protein
LLGDRPRRGRSAFPAKETCSKSRTGYVLADKGSLWGCSSPHSTSFAVARMEATTTEIVQRVHLPWQYSHLKFGLSWCVFALAFGEQFCYRSRNPSPKAYKRHPDRLKGGIRKRTVVDRLRRNIVGFWSWNLFSLYADQPPRARFSLAFFAW